MTAPRAFLVGTAKNEGPFILEWVGDHLEVGFTDIVIYQNDSDDLTHEILSLLQAMGVIQYFVNHAGRGGHQVRAYARAGALPEYKAAAWAMALDLDEFSGGQDRDGRLADCRRSPRKRSDAGQLAVVRILGASGLQSFRMQTERFTMADYLMEDNESFNAYKCLFRPAHIMCARASTARNCPRDRPSRRA